MSRRPGTAGIALVLALSLAACSSAPKKDLALEQVRNQLEELKANPELSGYAPLALGEAERALRLVETASGDDTYRNHLLYMADRRIQIARAVAQREQLDAELAGLEAEHSRMLVRASQLEAERARLEAERARMMSAATAEDAERAREREAESARTAVQAREEAEQARVLAETSARAADLARQEAELASDQAQSLRRQLENLQLRQTESGVVVTLGDVLFETGQAELREDARSSLVEVVDLLQSEPEKMIRIEGHTDAVGSAAANLDLSQRRAGSVLATLVSLGVDGARVTAVGMGEDFPIASNDTEDGRQRNRRVDVILLDK